MLCWYPLVEHIIPTPKTTIIPLQEIESIDKFLAPLYEGTVKDREMKRLLALAEKEITHYPIFLRSDQTSHKHDWNNSCYIKNAQSLAKGIANIFEFTLMTETLGFNAIILREFLELPHDFHAFNGMPISKEFRYFIKNGEVLCRHPYWFPNCMRHADTKDWLTKLKKLQTLTPETQTILDEYALKISRAVEPLKAPDNFWSVDFCIVAGQGWMMTDMALGNDSYHYGTCKNAPPEMLKRYGNPEDLPKGVST